MKGWDVFVCFSGMYLRTFPGTCLHAFLGRICILLQDMFVRFLGRVLLGIHACALFTDGLVHLLFWDTCVCFPGNCFVGFSADMVVCFSGTCL